MDKKELQQLISISEEIAFIERLEQLAKNGNGKLNFMVLPATAVGFSYYNGSAYPANTAPIILPQDLSELILYNLTSHKEMLQSIMNNLKVVDGSVTPDPETSEEKEGE